MLLFALIIVFKCYVKIRYKFWSYQPVFYYHNLLYWIYPKGVIDTAISQSVPNKFCNFINIVTKEFAEYDANDINKIVEFIAENYSTSFASSLTSYFSGVNNKTFISLYYKSNMVLRRCHTLEKREGVNEEMTFVSEQQIAAIMTTRSVNITLKDTPSFPAYYVDCLCVKKQDLAPETIQTHLYNVYHNDKTRKKPIMVSLFKRDGDGIIAGIVPLTAYNTYQFEISGLLPNRRASLCASMPVIEITKLNIQLLTSFICDQTTKFHCFVLPDLGNLLSLINNKIYMIYGIIENHELIAAYFFKKGEKSIDFIGSINNTNDADDVEVFIIGFNMALRKAIRREKTIKLLTIENIADNNRIVNNLFLLNIVPRFTNQTAYFYCNYAKRPIAPELALLIL